MGIVKQPQNVIKSKKKCKKKNGKDLNEIYFMSGVSCSISHQQRLSSQLGMNSLQILTNIVSNLVHNVILPETVNCLAKSDSGS